VSEFGAKECEKVQTRETLSEHAASLIIGGRGVISSRLLVHLHRGVTCTAQQDGVESISAKSRRNDHLGRVVGVTGKTDDRFIPIATWYTDGRTWATMVPPS
jgi:hypothetical protein